MNRAYKMLGAFLLTLLLLTQIDALPGAIDFTKDQRHQLSSNTIDKLKSLSAPVRIDIFLAGQLPAQYQHFRASVERLLTHFNRYTDQLQINFIDPFEQGSPETIVEEMQSFGLPPTYVSENSTSTNKETVLFPWAILNQVSRSVRVSLLKKNLGDTPEKILLQSLQQLEFQFMDGLEQLTLKEKHNIAFLTSHQCSKAVRLADWIQSLQAYYNVASFDLKKEGLSPQQTLQNLNRFRLLVVSNPKEPFSVEEKLILDQFQLQGGAVLWLLDGISLDENMLMSNEKGALITPLAIGLEDYFFNSGLRLQQTLLKDLYCAPLILAQGTANNTQYLPYPWPYYPLAKTNTNNAISKDLGSVWMRYSSPIDTLANALKKTVLLQSSPLTQIKGFPTTIQLAEAGNDINPADYRGQEMLLGVLLEGSFSSLFKNRIKPFELSSPLTNGSSKMMLIGDGAFGENQLDNGTPLPLGFDKWSTNFYDNKAFLLNSVHYLAGLNSLVEMRNKNFEISFLDPIKTAEKKTFWQLFLVGAPLAFLFLLGGLNFLLRNKH